ncbi:hypothetical protein N1027_04345 [Herbiconiux sp. CPCC 205763]|uniref:Uncharacterized protein n=1 Tax=Herbiconiux aconitum TaxID=2970913 RepID=A0ABT2GQY7_9MICO|nr:hypothetical protein [Herbiconiux aconitum]MCS5717364.1 hypothetical protein [Herbiconiux aconitum]
MRAGVDLVFFIAWASVGVVGLGVWFVATLRLSRRRPAKVDPGPSRAANTTAPAGATTPVSV